VQVSRRSRQKFADFAAAYGTLRTIEEAYAGQGFELPANFQLPTSGQRRAVCAAAEASVDPTESVVAERLVRVYLDAVDNWGRQLPIWGAPATDPPEFNDEARAVIRYLRRDGWPIDDDAALMLGSGPPPLPVEEFDRLDEPRVLHQHLDRISDGISRDPAAAIGSAKELVESTCKFILDDYNVTYPGDAGLLDLYKLAAQELRLTREAVPESAKGSRASHRVLQNLATAVQSLAELRNELGIGHGRTRTSPALTRHARLASNSARAVVEFLLETWHERRAKSVP
jgi:hypothetical protein